MFDEVKTTQQNHWEEGLKFLASTKFREATFRQSLITKINYQLEDNVIRAFYDVIHCCTESHKSAESTKDANSFDYDHTPIWILPFVFERLVLAPNPDPSGRPKITSLINERIRLFRSGQIQALYESSNEIKSRTPAEQSADPVEKQNCAQSAADCGNYRSANARLTKDTPVALVDESNIQALYDLYPASYNLCLPSAIQKTRGGKKNVKKLIIHPKIVSKVLSQLSRGKAPGLEIDSLDIFIKLARKFRTAKKKKKTTKIRPTVLARFFTILASGDLNPRILDIIRTTYLVALRKDANDNKKLRPLGIPAAIRRITAQCVLQMYRGRFASYLLPFNVALGIRGGVDWITTTMRLGVERYIDEFERLGELPSRALISLDIKNMFNAISREKLLHILEQDFPELVPFALSLYHRPGHTVLKRSDGTWESITVPEGFSQGCPASPIFAAIVLNHILKQVNQALCIRAQQRCADGNGLDDREGGKPIILAYVDDTNILVPLEDVEEFLKLFRKHGEKYGAVLNTEKTRIMTTTTGISVKDRLLANPEGSHLHSLGLSLERALKKYSRTKATSGPGTAEDGYDLVEVTDGLRILGVPIGSKSFCNNFIMNYLSKAVENSDAIIRGLDSKQTMLQLFRTCTAHKLTHLFAADVINAEQHNLPTCWNLWRSEMGSAFSKMVSETLAAITDQVSIPSHSELIATMSTSSGGLGIQHPRCSAIPSFILTTRRAIQYATDGVWVGHNLPLVHLPRHITSLYKNWRRSDAHTFQLFREYSPQIANICVSEQVDDPYDFFIHKAGLNTCRDRLRTAAADSLKHCVEHQFRDDKASLGQLEDMLTPRMSAALVDCPRIVPTNRRKNEEWGVMLKRKLRLPLWPSSAVPVCFCGKRMDRFGDHCLQCTHHCKTPLHNKIRDGLWSLFKRLFPLVHFCDSETSVQRETPRLIGQLPGLRPFDVSVVFDHMMDGHSWNTPLYQLGFDVTVIGSVPLATPDSSTVARKAEIDLRLREGEKKKFARPAHCDAETGVCMTGDEIVGEIISHNKALLPVAISPHGRVGSLFNRFLYGTDPLPPPKLGKHYGKERVHGAAAERLSRSHKVPRNVLGVADQIWRRQNPETMYGRHYTAVDPSAHFEQQFGLVISKAIASHILYAYGRTRKRPVRCSCPDDVCDTSPLPDVDNPSTCSQVCHASDSQTSVATVAVSR